MQWETIRCLCVYIFFHLIYNLTCRIISALGRHVYTTSFLLLCFYLTLGIHVSICLLISCVACLLSSLLSLCLSVYPSVLINVSVSPRSISMSKERCVLSFGTIIIIGLVLWSKLMFIQSVMFDWTIKRCAACWLQSFECPEVLPKAFALKNVTLQPSVVRFWLAKACSAILNRELAIRSESEQPMTCFMMDIGLWSH